MGDISFGGLATGLPTENLVTGLMKAERKPLERLEKQKTDDATHLKAYKQYSDLLNKLRESVSSMHLTSDARSTKTKVNNEKTLSASSSGAAVGSYNVAVTQLAQVQKNVGVGVSSQTEGLFSSGKITIGETEIVLDKEDNTLSGVAEAINAASAETGVKASIINDGADENNYHLVLTGKDASTSFTFENDLKIKAAEGEEARELTTTQSSVAQKAVAYIDGVKIESASNTISGAIPGLTINLNETSEVVTPATDDSDAVYATTVVDVAPDKEPLKKKITEFVDSYNKAMNWIVNGYSYKPEDASKTDSATAKDKESDSYKAEEAKKLSHLLRGDPTLNKAKRELQSVLGNSVDNSSKYNILAEIGITTKRDSTLVVNNTKLDKALDENYDDVVKLLAGDDSKDGVMDKLNTTLLNQTSSTKGVYAEKKKHYGAVDKRLDTQISAQKNQLKSIEKRIRAQFSALELLVSKMNSQSAYISKYLAGTTTTASK